MRAIPQETPIQKVKLTQRQISEELRKRITEALASPDLEVTIDDDVWTHEELDAGGAPIEYVPNYTITIRVAGGAGIRHNERKRKFG